MAELLNMSGRTVLLTGATKGMGLAMARAIGAAGGQVVLTGRTRDVVQRVATDLATQGISASGLELDVSSSDSVQDFIAAVSRMHSRIDGLVLNAASAAPSGQLLTQGPDIFDKAMASVRSDLAIVNAIAPGMRDRKDGSIVFISSRAAKRGSLGLGMYGMSKAAIDQYVRSLALELGPSNINVNSICPGLIRTDFSRGLWADPAKEAQLAASTPMRRIGEADDVVGLAVLLLSAAGRFIHGQNISVDGGMTA